MSVPTTFAPLPRYFRSRDAARHLAISQSTFFEFCRKGILPSAIKLGRLSFWEPAALVEAFDAHIASQQNAA